MIAGVGLAQGALAEEPVADTGGAEGGAEPVIGVGYDKGFFIRSADGDYGITFRALLQGRYTYESIDAPGGPEDVSNFSIPRARFQFGGNAFGKRFRYMFVTELGKGAVRLLDYYVDYDIVPDWLTVRVGQWKRPFARTFISSSSALQFTDPEITDEAFGAGRDIGIAFGNDYEKSPTLEWVVGVFNGTGEKGDLSGKVVVDTETGAGTITSGKFNNVPTVFNPTLVARIGFNHGGIKGYGETDLEGGPFRIAIGASGLVEMDADGDGESSIRGELDTILKVEGFSFSAAGYVASGQDGDSFDKRELQAGGLHAQTGYLIGGLVEPLFRYGLVSEVGDDNDVQVITGGVAIYFHGHSLKWVTDFAGILSETPTGDQTDLRLRTQVQLAL